MNEVTLLFYMLSITGGGGTGFMMGRMQIGEYSAIKWIAVTFALVLTTVAAYVGITQEKVPWILPIFAPWAVGVILGSIMRKKPRCEKCSG
jgi:hypothetical protein